MEHLSGIVERITYMNEENGFSVIKIKSGGFSDLVTVVGNLATINVGTVVKLKGAWTHNGKYGRQFSVSYYKEEIPATVYGLEKYLGSGLIKGIGPVYAKKIVNYFKEDTINIIEYQPDRLIEIDGIGSKRVEIIGKAWSDQKEIKNIMIFLQGHGISTTFAVKIYKAYGNESIEKVKDNPYRLADDIWGIGFKTADRIAMNMGFEKKSYERCRSGIVYCLNELSNNGHCFSNERDLITIANEFLELEEIFIQDSLKRMLEEKIVVGEQDNIFLPALYYCEVGVAKRIRDIFASEKRIEVIEIDNLLYEIRYEESVLYDNTQIEGIKLATKSKLMVLTGGPGTGKTTTTLGIIKIYIKSGAKVLLAAPTGRAAKRLSETTGMEAKTIHRLLEYSPAEGYKINENNKLNCDVLLIDEVSMMDIVLMYNLLRAVNDQTTVILVGDVDQLPSVGPGNVLNDIINSGCIDVFRLTRVFRQAANSLIISNAHRINSGLLPITNKNESKDFYFISEDDPKIIVEKIKDLYLNRLPKHYAANPLEDMQVLCPMQRGDTGTINLNIVLQQALNKSEIQIKHAARVFNLNDKVMQIKNNYDKSVFNGDIGKISGIDQEDKKVRITFDHREILYELSELDEIVLAYAVTVHKSQGSEFDIVIAPFTMQHYMMLQRNLLYTCITRAKKLFVLIGSKKAIAIAVSNDKIQSRNTSLNNRIKLVIP